MYQNKINTALSDVDWDDIMYTLKEEKCVLFIGSGIFQAPGGGNIEDALCKWLDTKNPEHPHIKVHNSDGFYLFKKNRYRRKVVSEMKDFFNRPFPETEILFKKIAQIPFPIISTITFDNVLARTFDDLGLDYQPDFYFRNRKGPEVFEGTSKNRPLIYNLLGNIEEPESIILTHGDFFDYLQSVFQGNSMNGDLRDRLESMERYIFLGLPYEKWYFQLLLRTFSMHSDKLKEIERLALKEFENPNLHKIYTSEFKLDFFPVNPEEFIEELYQQCQNRGMLKSLSKLETEEIRTPDPTESELRNLVASAETETAIKLLKIYLKRRKPRSYNLSNDLIVLSNRFHLLEQRERQGTIDYRDYSVESNQIIKQLLLLISEAQKL